MKKVKHSWEWYTHERGRESSGAFGYWSPRVQSRDQLQRKYLSAGSKSRKINQMPQYFLLRNLPPSQQPSIKKKNQTNKKVASSGRRVLGSQASSRARDRALRSECYQSCEAASTRLTSQTVVSALAQDLSACPPLKALTSIVPGLPALST